MPRVTQLAGGVAPGSCFSPLCLIASHLSSVSTLSRKTVYTGGQRFPLLLWVSVFCKVRGWGPKTVFSSDSLCSSGTCLLPEAFSPVLPAPPTPIPLGVPRKTGRALGGRLHLGLPFKTTRDLSSSPSPAVPLGEGRMWGAFLLCPPACQLAGFLSSDHACAAGWMLTKSTHLCNWLCHQEIKHFQKASVCPSDHPILSSSTVDFILSALELSINEIIPYVLFSTRLPLLRLICL